MPIFTEADIRAGASAQAYSRGVGYYHDSAVLELSRRDNVISAEVEGSDLEPYAITVALTATGGIGSASCNCPYDLGGYCKHIVAVLLAVLNDAERVEVQPGMEMLLAGLTETQLRQIIVNAAQTQPAFADLIEREVNLLHRTLAVPAQQTLVSASAAPAIDLVAVRRELRRDFRQATSHGGGYRGEYYDYDDGETIDGYGILYPHTMTADALLNADAPAAAAELLAIVVEEWGACLAALEEWLYEANEDGIREASSEVDARLAESLLSQTLSAEERQAWRKRVYAWADDLLRLSITAAALEYWWDYPPLAAAMQGHITEQGAWEGEAPAGAGELAFVRLRVLERQGRLQEYLNLAQAEGEVVLYLTKLVQIGEIAHAVNEAQAYLSAPEECLMVANVLAEHGHGREALTVAACGLDATYPYHMDELARWIVPLAEQLGDRALAMRAARTAFHTSHTLPDYQAVERVAGADWQNVKGELLVSLQQAHAYTAIDIYLYERMLPEAMAVVDRGLFYGDLMRVVEATRADYPDWAIRKCKQNAELTMDGGKAKYYENAVQWLRRARDICAQHNRNAEWQVYLDGLLETHSRKYKLVPMLRTLF